MTLAAVATEAKATALITECRRCLAIGVDLKAQYIKDVLDQLEAASSVNLTARTDVAADNTRDGRNSAEATAVA